MIRSFGDKSSAAIWEGRYVRSLDRTVQRAALRKMEQIHAARALVELRVPPGNRLELLKGNRSGQYSIRVNDQWRICFTWTDGVAEDVELVDYH